MKDKIRALPKLDVQSRILETCQILRRMPDESTERYIREEVQKIYKISDDVGADVTARENAAEVFRQYVRSRRYWGD